MPSLAVTIALLLGSAVVIYLACEYFVNGVEWVGEKMAVGQKATGTILAAFGTAFNGFSCIGQSFNAKMRPALVRENRSSPSFRRMANCDLPELVGP